MKTQKVISRKRIERIRAQGYQNYTPFEISRMAFGNRFAYILCTVISAYGIITFSAPTVFLMFIVAFLGVVLPYHPFDYIYNHILSSKLKKPKIPERSPQLKFACTMASIFLALTAFLYHIEYNTIGLVIGSTLLVIAFLVSTLDYCIPSIIYNKFKRETITNLN